MQIIPAIDIINSNCVRLTKGDFNAQTKYCDYPLELAKKFAKENIDFLHLVDLDGARFKKPCNQTLILQIANTINKPVEVGGGIRSLKTAEFYLENGISRIILGTKAIEDLNFLKTLLQKFGPEKIILGLDVKNDKLGINGWQNFNSQKNIFEFVKDLTKIGLTTAIVTDINKDGTLTTPNFKLFQKIQKLGLNVVASGGISDLNSLRKLQELNIQGAIIGKALYENKLDLQEAINLIKPKSNLTKRIIPCLDIIKDKVVKGVKFQKMQIIGDAVELGQKYYQNGADELVFLDIKATKDNKATLVEVVKKIAAKIFIPFTVGGGINSLSKIKEILRAGADKVSLNSAAVLNPKLIQQASRRFGSQAIVVAIDVKKENKTYQVYIRAGTQKTNLEAISWAKTVAQLGAGEILLTSIDRDGTKNGYDLDLLNQLSKAVKIPVIASGGAGTKEHIKQALQQGKADAVLAASIFHQQKITIKSLKNYLFKSNLPIRL